MKLFRLLANLSTVAAMPIMYMPDLKSNDTAAAMYSRSGLVIQKIVAIAPYKDLETQLKIVLLKKVLHYDSVPDWPPHFMNTIEKLATDDTKDDWKLLLQQEVFHTIDVNEAQYHQYHKKNHTFSSFLMDNLPKSNDAHSTGLDLLKEIMTRGNNSLELPTNGCSNTTALDSCLANKIVDLLVDTQVCSGPVLLHHTCLCYLRVNLINSCDFNQASAADIITFRIQLEDTCNYKSQMEEADSYGDKAVYPTVVFWSAIAFGILMAIGFFRDSVMAFFSLKDRKKNNTPNPPQDEPTRRPSTELEEIPPDVGTTGLGRQTSLPEGIFHTSRFGGGDQTTGSSSTHTTNRNTHQEELKQQTPFNKKKGKEPEDNQIGVDLTDVKPVNLTNSSKDGCDGGTDAQHTGKSQSKAPKNTQTPADSSSTIANKRKLSETCEVM